MRRNQPVLRHLEEDRPGLPEVERPPTTSDLDLLKSVVVERLEATLGRVQDGGLSARAAVSRLSEVARMLGSLSSQQHS